MQYLSTRRAWLIGGLVLVLVLLSLAGYLTFRNTRDPAGSDGPADQQRVDHLCDLVDVSPLQSLSLREDTGLRRTTETTDDGDRHQVSCTVSLAAAAGGTADYVKTVDYVKVEASLAGDAAAAGNDYADVQTLDGADDTSTELAGLGDRAFMRIVQLQSSSDGAPLELRLAGVDVFAIAGRLELNVSLGGSGARAWDLDNARDAVLAISRSTLAGLTG